MTIPTRTLASIGTAGLLAMSLAACGSDAGGTGGAEAEEGAPTFAFVTGDISDFGQVQIEGMKSVVEPLGGSLTVFDSSDVETQNADCMDIVSSGRYNGIVLNPLSGPGSIPCVDGAREAGIPVVGLETIIGPDETQTAPQVDGVIASVSAGLIAGGEASADLLEEACEGKDPCRYIQIVGSQAYQLEAVKLQVFEERFGGDSRFQRVALGEDGYNPEEGRQVVRDLLAANPDVDVILNSTDSTAVQVVDMLEAEGRDDVVVLGDGASRQGVESIKEGGVYGTTVLAPFTWGEIAAQALVDHINGDDVITPEEVADEITPYVLTEGNVEGIEGQWG
ncbi:sugar ABC transporter substrate-binding protein [Modestobacter sp. VKM Ac-2978]|uniref:sugar ABC transporter substrate-binding protein n=1 Tax=Modestobacter sp. VKM Ac-2978 TaxID=3004132 RepID=UPI0022AA40B1|nr:sugar ABC transporter substrate-binding protein [Modestobacter sp. VKM Ac-2978]MCZ2849914.1 sugar ABC transporter substrate-binding protein [Modestobacter sp. VKM Ac-2978]